MCVGRKGLLLFWNAGGGGGGGKLGWKGAVAPKETVFCLAMAPLDGSLGATASRAVDGRERLSRKAAAFFFPDFFFERGMVVAALLDSHRIMRKVANKMLANMKS